MRELAPVTAKQMFGGWGLYHDGAFFALIIDDALHLKAGRREPRRVRGGGLEPFVYVTKDGDAHRHVLLPGAAEALENPAAMAAWASSAYAAALRAKSAMPAAAKRGVAKAE
jgi:DNA transformation protein